MFRTNLIPLLLLIMIALPAVAVSPGDRWVGFRGDGDSATAAVNLPTEWSAKQHIVWRRDLPGHGQSAPVVLDGVVYVTAVQSDASHTKQGLQALAIDAATGEDRWWAGFTPSIRQSSEGNATKAAPTPIVADDGLYVFFETGDLAALDLDGEVRWERALAREFSLGDGGFGLAASLALTDEAVVVLVDQAEQSYLLLADRTTGETQLKKDRDTKVSYCTPRVLREAEGGIRLLVSSDGEVGELDGRTGEPIWTIATDGSVGITSPVLADDRVIIADAFKKTAVAVRRGGEGDVTGSHIDWRLNGFDIGYHSPLAHDGRLYMAEYKGKLVCVEAATGRKLWEHQLTQGLWTAPIAAGERVYCFTAEGATHVLEPDDEGPNEIAVNQLPGVERVYGVAPIDGGFILRTPDELIRIGTRPEP
jgi:outer membrane protein assembly factor BamB